MTSINYRAHLLCYEKTLCIISYPFVNSKLSHNPEMPNLVQNWRFFCTMWPWNLMDDLEKTTGHLFCAISSFVHDFIAIGEFKLNRAPLLSNIRLCASFLHHMWIQTGVTFRKRLSWVMTSVTLTFCMDITSVNGNNSWKLQDDTMTGTLSTRTTLERRTTLGRHRSIKLNMINHFAIQSQTCELLKSIFF